MNISPISINSQTAISKSNPNFKADFVFTKASARALKREMKDFAYKHPLKTLRGQNPLQILIKKIKAMHPGEKIKLNFQESKYCGTSYLTGRGVYSDAYWYGESSTGKRVSENGYHMSESGYISSDTPIQDILEKICSKPEEFFGA